MRLSFITLFLACLSLTTVAKPQFLSRRDQKRTPIPNVLTSRQYHAPRDLLDICINTDVNLLADAAQLLGLESILGPLDLFTNIHLCLCLKDLQIFLDTNAEIQALVGILGHDTVAALINALINTSPDARQCHLPPHAHRTCNNDDPCHWACDDHYVRDEGICVCSPPFISCNGICGLFSQGCPSAVPRSFKEPPAFRMRLNNYGRSVATPNNIDSELSSKITVLVHLVIDLQGNSTALGTQSNYMDSDLLTPIVQATVDILNATTASSLLESLDKTFELSRTNLYLLEHCKCIQALELEHLYTTLNAIIRTASDAQAWCHDHSIVPRRLSQGKGTADGDDIPIVVGLSDLLTRLTLGLLGPTKSSIKVDGLGADLSGPIDNLLDELGLGPNNAKRESFLEGNAFLSTDSSASGQLKVLVNLVVQLQVSMSSFPSSESGSCLDSVQPALMREVVDGLAAITYSSTVSASLSSVNRILAAETDLLKALEKCRSDKVVEDLIELLVVITEITLEFGEICRIGSTTFAHRPTTLATISTSIPTTSSRTTSPYTRPSTLSVYIQSLTSIHGNLSVIPHPTSSRTQSLSTSLPTPSLTPLSDDETIVALNHLLSSLGLAGAKGVVTIGGLGPGLTDSVNNLLDGLGIGPHGLHRRGRRQVVVNADTNVASDQRSQKDAALIDLVLGLVDACDSLDCAHLETPDIDFVGAILNANANILTSKSWMEFAEALDSLAALSSEAIKFLEGRTSGRLGVVHEYMTRILDVIFTLQGLTLQIGVDNLGQLSVHDETPVVVGLTRLSNELHVRGEGFVAVSGVGGIKLN